MKNENETIGNKLSKDQEKHFKIMNPNYRMTNQQQQRGMKRTTTSML
jgi:hypothetical protein